MKLVYTGANGARVMFPRGVEVQSPDGQVRSGEVVEAHDPKVIASLVAQGVCVPFEEPQAKPEPQPVRAAKPAKKIE